MEEWRELYQEIEDTLEEKFTELRRSVVKNLSHLVLALVILLRTPRGWYGKLSLSGISRGMRTEGEVKARYKRLHRFLDNPLFQDGRFKLWSFGAGGWAAGPLCSAFDSGPDSAGRYSGDHGKLCRGSKEPTFGHGHF